MLPIKADVGEACEILGIDPLQVANEGKLIAVVAPDSAERLVHVLKNEELGSDARIIGEVTEEHAGKVVMKTLAGAIRVVDMLSGEQLPRIC
jgi:hydrogenase expression/formation protein HypE